MSHSESTLKSPLVCPICYCPYFKTAGFEQHLKNHQWHNAFLKPGMFVKLKTGGYTIISKRDIKMCRYATGSILKIFTKTEIRSMLNQFIDLAPDEAPPSTIPIRGE